MFTRTFSRIAQQAVSLALAAAVTLAMLGGINGLAVPPAPDALLAQVATPASAPAHS